MRITKTQTIRSVLALFFLIGMFPDRTLATEAVHSLELWRLDCGRFLAFNIAGMSDVFAYPAGKTKTLANGCYLIRHDQTESMTSVALYPRAPGYEAVATCRARPNVRARLATSDGAIDAAPRLLLWRQHAMNSIA